MQDYCRQLVHEAAVNPVPQRSSGSGQEGTGHPLLMPLCAYLPQCLALCQVFVSVCKTKPKNQTNKQTKQNKQTKEQKNTLSSSTCWPPMCIDELVVPSEPARHALRDLSTMMFTIDYVSSHVCTANVLGMIASPEGAQRITFGRGNHAHHICCANMR